MPMKAEARNALDIAKIFFSIQREKERRRRFIIAALASYHRSGRRNCTRDHLRTCVCVFEGEERNSFGEPDDHTHPNHREYNVEKY